MAHATVEQLTAGWRVARFPTKEEAIAFSVHDFIECAHAAISTRGLFKVALSGGSTPKAIYQQLSSEAYAHKIDWKKCLLFWSDERAVPPDHPESNYKMVMDAGFSTLPIPEAQIFRMEADHDLEVQAAAYNHLIREKVGEEGFDLMMLGMGEDGHTASLFPDTEALKVKKDFVAANYISQKEDWRMTLTYPCINQAHSIRLYVLGEKKWPTLTSIWKEGPQSASPVSWVGTPAHPALWITDIPSLK